MDRETRPGCPWRLAIGGSCAPYPRRPAPVIPAGACPLRCRTSAGAALPLPGKTGGFRGFSGGARRRGEGVGAPQLPETLAGSPLYTFSAISPATVQY
jgi:hypothetical protein